MNCDVNDIPEFVFKTKKQSKVSTVLTQLMKEVFVMNELDNTYY